MQNNPYGYGYGQGVYNAPSPPRNTNVILVTGPDEAVMRTPNDADMLYIDQAKPVMYRVVSDMWGRKSLAEYPYVIPNTSDNAPVTRAEFQTLSDRLAKLENTTQEVVDDGKPVQ